MVKGRTSEKLVDPPWGRPLVSRLVRSTRLDHAAQVRVIPVPVLRDNYAYLLVSGRTAAVVDPGESKPILEAAESFGVEIQSVLLTHHHPDHVGGLDDLRVSRVIASEIDRSKIPGATESTQPDQNFEVIGQVCRSIDVACHTRGHVAYFFAGSDPLLFSGDTLFNGGCGRFFEGTAADMARALDALTQLPPATLIYSGHEYTVRNLEFAEWLEPANPFVLKALERARSLRSEGLPTVPTTLAEELTYNPFLRFRSEELARVVVERGGTAGSPVETLAAIRALKDVF